MRKLNSSLFCIFILVFVFFLPLLLVAGRIAGNYGDIYLHYYPLKYLVTEHLIRGQTPLWNPYIFAGQPLAANPQAAIFYPLSILFAIFPLHAAFNYFFVLHFLCAGTFFYIFMCRQKVSAPGALFSSIAFTFSSFLVYKIPAGHPAALSGYVWLPLIMLLADRGIRRDINLPWTILFSLTLAFIFLSGHTFPWYIALVYITFLAAARRFTPWRSLLITGACFFLFSAVQFVPTLQLSRSAETMNWSILVQNYSLSIKHLISAILPDYFGNPLAKTFYPQGNPSYFFERLDLYFGALALFAGIAGLVTSVRKKEWFYPLLFIIGLIFALGFNNPAYRFFYAIIPGLDYLRVPARFILLSIIALLVCAGFAWDRYLKNAPVFLKVVLLLLVTGELFFWNARFVYTEDIAAYRSQNTAVNALNPAYRIITDADHLASNKSMLYHHYNLNGYEAILLTDFVRYLGLQEHNVFSATGLAKTDFNSPLARAFAPGYRITRSTTSATHRGMLSISPFTAPLPRAYFARNAVIIPDDDVYRQMEYLRSTTLPPDEEILLAAKPSDFMLGGRPGKVIAQTISPLTCAIDAVVPAPGILVLSELAYPGWQAYVSGRQMHVQRAHKIFRALLLPPGLYTGSNRIYFVFRPASWFIGLYTTLLFVLAALAGGAFLIVRRCAQSIPECRRNTA